MAAVDGGGVLSGLPGESASGLEEGGRLLRGWPGADARPPRSSATASLDEGASARGFLLADAKFIWVVASFAPASVCSCIGVPVGSIVPAASSPIGVRVASLGCLAFAEEAADPSVAGNAGAARPACSRGSSGDVPVLAVAATIVDGAGESVGSVLVVSVAAVFAAVAGAGDVVEPGSVAG